MSEVYDAPIFEMDDLCVSCGSDEIADKSNICSLCQERYGVIRFGAESGDPDKTTTSLNAKFFVGKGDGKDLRGHGKFMKYDDAVAKAKKVAEKEGKSRVVSTRGFALWTHDGKGLFQVGKSTAEAKKYYSAEDGSIDMNSYANDYMAAEDGYFDAEGDKETGIAWVRRKMKPYRMNREERRAEGILSKMSFGSLVLIAGGVGIAWMLKNNEEWEAPKSIQGRGSLWFKRWSNRRSKRKFKGEGSDCGCGCKGGGGCGDKEVKNADKGHYPNTYDPVQDFLPRYRYPEDSDWSNDYNPADPYRPLDYQTMQTSNGKGR